MKLHLIVRYFAQEFTPGLAQKVARDSTPPSPCRFTMNDRMAVDAQAHEIIRLIVPWIFVDMMDELGCLGDPMAFTHLA